MSRTFENVKINFKSQIFVNPHQFISCTSDNITCQVKNGLSRGGPRRCGSRIFLENSFALSVSANLNLKVKGYRQIDTDEIRSFDFGRDCTI